MYFLITIEQCGDEEESQTMTVFSAQTPLSSRFSLPIPLGKKHDVATVDVFEEAQLIAKVSYINGKLTTKTIITNQIHS